MKKTTTTAKKKTNKIAKPLRRAPLSETPLGLRLLVSLVQDDDVSRDYSHRVASDALPIARGIVASLNDDNADFLNKRLLAAVTQFHGLLPEEMEGDDASFAADCAFHVGMTVAWLLMTELQGGQR